MSTTSRLSTCRLVCSIVAVLAVSAPAWSQVLGPPVTGTIQPEPNKKKFYEGVGAAAAGTEKVVHAIAGRGDDNGLFPGLREGSTVAVKAAPANVDGRPAASGDMEAATEGVVTVIDRKRKQIVVRFETGKTERLQFVDRARGDAGPAPVVVTYPDGSGGKLSLDFKRAS